MDRPHSQSQITTTDSGAQMRTKTSVSKLWYTFTQPHWKEVAKPEMRGGAQCQQVEGKKCRAESVSAKYDSASTAKICVSVHLLYIVIYRLRPWAGSQPKPALRSHAGPEPRRWPRAAYGSGFNFGELLSWALAQACVFLGPRDVAYGLTCKPQAVTLVALPP